MRSDARRNRQRLLEVADEVFTTEGMSVPTEEIAKRAGVGVGTLFRHFPTKGALLEAVFVQRLGRLVDRAKELDDGDPAEAFFTFLAENLDHAATKNAYVDALTEAGVDVGEAMGSIQRDLLDAFATLLDKAQRAGAVRADLRVSELIALFVGGAKAIEHAGDNAAARRRIVDVLLAGLRA
ncbi:MAG: TetR/AcrR family transcriptional regulator, partial [Sciscionella sp.]|nr:TetR/AcrR family transcriptional regulator [Sciscionella sp.]